MLEWNLPVNSSWGDLFAIRFVFIQVDRRSWESDDNELTRLPAKGWYFPCSFFCMELDGQSWWNSLCQKAAVVAGQEALLSKLSQAQEDCEHLKEQLEALRRHSLSLQESCTSLHTLNTQLQVTVGTRRHPAFLPSLLVLPIHFLLHWSRWNRRPSTPSMQQCCRAAARARPGAQPWRPSPRCGHARGRSQQPGWKLWGGTTSGWRRCNSGRKRSLKSCWTNTPSWGAATAAWRRSTGSWRPGTTTQWPSHKGTIVISSCPCSIYIFDSFLW